MKNRFLSPLAALLLLLPATVLLPLPAAAQYGAPVAAAPFIERFVLRGDGRIEAGEELRFRLHGASYAQAWVDIPGVANGIAMREVRPGVYEAAYVVRRRDDPDAFERAVASLQAGGQRVSARVQLREDNDWGQGRRNDTTPPQIAEVFPAQGAVLDDGRLRIAARVSDDGRRGIDPESVTLRVDGRDVTRDARLRGNEIEYRADLPRGRHSAELVVRDRAGNAARRAWSFDVVERNARVTPAVPIIPLPGAAVVVPAARPLEVLSPALDSEWDVRHPAPIRGRTFPFATVRLLVSAVADTGGGNTQVTVVDDTVRADAAGNFVIVARQLPALVAISPDFYQLHLTATAGGQTAQTQMRLRHRNG